MYLPEYRWSLVLIYDICIFWIKNILHPECWIGDMKTIFKITPKKKKKGFRSRSLVWGPRCSRFPCVVMIYYWAALSPPAFTWMLEFFCMIMMYNEIQPWIDDYQVFVWVLVGLHHSFVILQKLDLNKYLIKILFQHWFISLDWFISSSGLMVVLHQNTSRSAPVFGFFLRPGLSRGGGGWIQNHSITALFCPLLFICSALISGFSSTESQTGNHQIWS